MHRTVLWSVVKPLTIVDCDKKKDCDYVLGEASLGVQYWRYKQASNENGLSTPSGMYCQRRQEKKCQGKNLLSQKLAAKCHTRLASEMWQNIGQVVHICTYIHMNVHM